MVIIRRLISIFVGTRFALMEVIRDQMYPGGDKMKPGANQRY